MSTPPDASLPGEGLGLWRGPAEPLEPALEQGGQPEQRITNLQETEPIDEQALQQREQAAALALLAHTQPAFYNGVAQGNTDASGNAVIQLYEVRAGMIAYLNRLVVNASAATATGYYTPAVPYSNAGAWVGIFHADSGPIDGAMPAGALSQGGLRDFAPATAGGPILPGLFTDDPGPATGYRGPCSIVLKIVTGPASTLVTCYVQLQTEKMRGIA